MKDGPDIRMKRMLTCRDVDEFLVSYMDERLDDELRTRFEKHIGRCTSCMSYFEQYRDTTRLVREAGELAETPPDELIESTLSFLREHTARKGDERNL